MCGCRPVSARDPGSWALYGLGGAGKSNVAVEYAHRHLAEVGLAWQFSAEDPAVLKAEFGELAAQLSDRDLFHARDPVAVVHGVLAAYPRGWLLVFDNAPDPESVQRFLPPAGRGRVLITTQSAVWPRGQAVEVPVLDTVVAAGFLVNRTGDGDQRAAEELAGELDGLPLALEQAAAYSQATGTTLAGYLSVFRDRRADLLARGQAAEHPADVAATLGLALSRLEEQAPAAAGLLRLLAFLAPEPVPLTLLLQPRPGLAEQFGRETASLLAPLLEDPLATSDAIAALRRYSLVSPLAEGVVSVHRLVQAVTAHQMPAELAAEWRQAAAALIEAALPGNPEQPQARPEFAALLPHALTALTADRPGADRIISYLAYSGSYAVAVAVQHRVLDIRDQMLGPEHPGTLVARAHLARWTGLAGDAPAARDQCADLTSQIERVFGLEHMNTLTARVYLIEWTGQAGDAAAARDQYIELLPVIERVFGPEHPETLTAQANLARWTAQAGDTAAARDQYIELLPVIERVFGPEHPETLTAQANLAYLTGATDAAQARDQYAALVLVRERVLGAEHPDTLKARVNLAAFTGVAGDAAAARDQYAELLPVIERVFGPEHPQSRGARANLAYWTRQADGGSDPSTV